MNTLLICPKFFGYEKDIYQSLIDQNHNVIYIDEKPYNNTIFKIIVRLSGRHFIVRNFIKKYIERSIANIQLSLDYIIIVKGESFSVENIRYLKEKHPHAKFLFYAWDSVKNYPHVIEYLPLFDRCYTFDDKDIENYTFFKHLPLFYSKEYEVENIAKAAVSKYRVVFAGTVHSDRYQLLGELYKRYKNIYDFDFFLYFPSRLLLLKFIIKNYRLILKYRILSFSLQSKSKKEIADYFLNATAIIDIQHPKQHGLTMRTIEILPLQRKLITTNSEIKRYDFYHNENIMVIDRDDPILDEQFLLTPFKEIDPKIVHQYSVNGWVTKLLAAENS